MSADSWHGCRSYKREDGRITVTAVIGRVLAKGPATSSELTRQVSRATGRRADAALSRSVRSRLNTLADAGVLSRAPDKAAGRPYRVVWSLKRGGK